MQQCLEQCSASNPKRNQLHGLLDKEYEVKGGRWIDGLNDKHLLLDKDFPIEYHRITRQPLDHFLHWFETEDNDDLFRSAPLESKQWQPLCNLEGLD